MKTVLVTGAAGFIGSFLTEELVARGYFVVGIDNFFRGKRANVAHLERAEKIKLIEMDLSQQSAAVDLKNIILNFNIEIIFHLAAINGTQYFYDRSTFVFDQNVRITQTVITAVKDTQARYLIYTSSSEVYGEPLSLPTPEEHPILLNAFADRDSYAASKAVGDFYTRLFAQENNMDYLILRVFNMYGERMVNTRYGQVIPEFVKKALSAEPFTIIGNGEHARSFCYIRDAVSIMCDLMELRVKGIINIGNDDEITILQLAEKIHAILQKPFQPVFLPERPHDHKRRQPDLSKLKTLLPAVTWTTLQTGLHQVIEYYTQTSDLKVN